MPSQAVVGLNNAVQLSRAPPQLPGKLLVSVDSRIPKLGLDGIMLIQQALYGLKHFQNLSFCTQFKSSARNRARRGGRAP